MTKILFLQDQEVYISSINFIYLYYMQTRYIRFVFINYNDKNDDNNNDTSNNDLDRRSSISSMCLTT